MGTLPPDLSRLGDELAAAAARSLERRRRRLRASASVGACALIAAAAVVATGALGSTSEEAQQLADPQLSAVVVRPPDRHPLQAVTRPGHRSAPVVPAVILGDIGHRE